MEINKKLLTTFVTFLTIVHTALAMPTELIDLDKLYSPNSMTKGLLPEVYYAMLNFFSKTWGWFLIIISVISIVIIIVLLGGFFKRIMQEHL